LVELLSKLVGRVAQEESMGSINPPKKKDYGKNTRIDVNQSYQLAYWTDRFGISEEELIEAVRDRRTGDKCGGVSKPEAHRTLNAKMLLYDGENLKQWHVDRTLCRF
jgi:hypothetical protein